MLDGLVPDATLLERASASFLAGQSDEAERICHRVLQDEPGDAGALRQLGLIRLVGGDPAGCQALLLPLQDVFAEDPDLAIALAEAAWTTTGAEAAIPHYRHAVALAPTRARVRARLGLALLTTGQPGAARHMLEAATAAAPDAETLTHLGMALLAEGRSQDAMAPLLRAAEADSGDPASLFHLGQALRDLGRIDDALVALAEAVRRGPDQAHLHFAYGDALFARGEHAKGQVELRQATALDPTQPLAWAKLGDMEQLAGDTATALSCYRCASQLDDGNPGLLALLGNALLAAGDQAGSRELARSMEASWAGPRARGLSIGILAAPGGSNTPTDYIVDRTRLAATPIFLLDGHAYPTAELAHRYDVLFNAVGDPDAAPGALAQAGDLAASLALPVVNAPALIQATTRDRMSELLAGIPGLHIPRTIRCSRTELDGLALDGPVLVRAVGSHGGKGLAVAQTPKEIRDEVATLGADEVYITQFADTRSAGGLYRKLRVVFVDGQCFPVHLAVGDHWLSHYFRTTMADMPAWRAEEAAFLAGHEAYLGRDVCRALAELHGRVGLDFFGVDGAIGPDGRLVVFECNAAMLVRHADRPAIFDYKREPAERIRDAVSGLLRRLATLSPR